MMRYLFYVTFLLLSVSCQTDKTKSIIKSHIEDYAFKNNTKVDFHELKILSTDLKSENFLDTLRMFELDRQFDSLNTEIKNMRNLIVESEKGIENIVYFGSDNPLFKMKYNEHQKLLSKYSKLLKEMKENSKQDSLIKVHISRNSSPNTITRVKVFQKSTYTNRSNQIYNFMDTVYFYLDSDNNIIR